MSPYGVSTFCDDIRFELQNKISLIGCYGSELILHDRPPIVLPKMGILIHVRTPPERLPSIKITVTAPGMGDPIFVFERPPETEELESTALQKWEAQGIDTTDIAPQRGVMIPAVFSPLHIAKIGFLKVRMDYGDQKGIRIGSLLVKFQELANPSPTS